jgi:hypothetical protein
MTVQKASEWNEHILQNGKLLQREVQFRGRTRHQVTFVTADGKVHKLVCTPVKEFYEANGYEF